MYQLTNKAAIKFRNLALASPVFSDLYIKIVGIPPDRDNRSGIVLEENVLDFFVEELLSCCAKSMLLIEDSKTDKLEQSYQDLAKQVENHYDRINCLRAATTENDF